MTSFALKLAVSFVVGIQLFANIFNIDWLYQGFEEYRYIMFRSLFVKLVALASVFIFVHDTSDYIIYALITALSLVANFVFNIAHMHKYVDITFREFVAFKEHVRIYINFVLQLLLLLKYTHCVQPLF